MNAVGASLPHESAVQHVTGSATYLDDLPPIRGELLVDWVGSPIAHGTIRSIDTTDAKAIAGIIAVYTAADVPHNDFGPIFHDEEVLADKTVLYVGQPIVAIAGETREAILAAKKAIRIVIDPLPAILTIREAIEQKSFIGPTRRIVRGDVTKGLAEADHRLTGTFIIGGQEHFYLEPQTARAIPEEAGTLTVHSSTQNPSEIQAVVAHCLGRSFADIVCVCKRMGGGFGGKETQAAQPAILVALTAMKTGRPARITYEHEQDFRSTGKRHPYECRYEVGFTTAGRITALASDFHSDGGFSADLSLAIMERTLLHAENAYFLENIAVTGTVCRTHKPSNTAFRGFGGPQGVAAMENVIQEVATYLKLDALDIRKANVYAPERGEVTHYGQRVRNNTLPNLIEELAASSEYECRRADILAFNEASKTHRKGLALTPVKFGISFTRRTLNQGNALVNIYLDGTVQVSTGGTEMGQGLNTKIRQVVAEELGIPVERVRMMPTSTEKNNNTSPTAASAGMDLNGTAARNAAAILRNRLAEVAASLTAEDGLEPSPSHMDAVDERFIDRRKADRSVAYLDVVKQAYERRIDLGARGFYATPGVDFNRETGKGTPFLYYTNGAAVAEVLIDRFTGETELTRLHMLMDIGKAINPAIDRGQLIGGFVQGMGWVTNESLQYSSDGRLLSDSATTYKIPNISDIPTDFRLTLYDNPHNSENLHGSKAVGEPPLLLGMAVWCAIRDAVTTECTGRPPAMALPATTEEILRVLELINVAEQEPLPKRTRPVEVAS